jgi:hypothetical protein
MYVKHQGTVFIERIYMMNIIVRAMRLLCSDLALAIPLLAIRPPLACLLVKCAPVSTKKEH